MGLNKLVCPIHIKMVFFCRNLVVIKYIRKSMFAAFRTKKAQAIRGL